MLCNKVNTSDTHPQTQWENRLKVSSSSWIAYIVDVCVSSVSLLKSLVSSFNLLVPAAEVLPVSVTSVPSVPDVCYVNLQPFPKHSSQQDSPKPKECHNVWLHCVLYIWAWQRIPKQTASQTADEHSKNTSKKRKRPRNSLNSQIHAKISKAWLLFLLKYFYEKMYFPLYIRPSDLFVTHFGYLKSIFPIFDPLRQ